MTAAEQAPPWVWDDVPDDEFRDRWDGLVAFVDWLTEAHAPWVVLPPCWPDHIGLRDELTMFWYWHGWLTTKATDPVAGIRFHADLRHSAAAWRELSTCDHRPPRPEHAQIAAAQRARTASFVAEIVARHHRGPTPPH